MSYHLIYGHLQQITFTAVSPDILNPTDNISGLSQALRPVLFTVFLSALNQSLFARA